MAKDGVEICSQALILLGIAPITSFEDETDKAATCDNMYEMLVEKTIGEYQWRFTTKKVQLARLTETPVNEWKYFYQLPSDRVGPQFALFNSSAQGATPIQDFERFREKIACDEETVFIDYRIRPDEPDWPPYFATLMVYTMAAHLAEALTDDSSKADMWMRVAFGQPGEDSKGGYSRTARNLDAQQQPPQMAENFELIAARMGGS